MSRKAYVATVQILIDPKFVGDEANACDWTSECLRNNDQVLDWSYLQNEQGKYIPPQQIEIPDDYEEGDFVNEKLPTNIQTP